MAAVQSPRRAMHAIGEASHGDRRERAYDDFGPQPAALPAGSAGIRPQLVLFDDDGVFDLKLLARAVVRIAVIGANHAVHAVFGRLRAPPAAGRADKADEEITVDRV